ncbi:HlyD family secretion protein [Adhaeribacter soli]|uniref:HlyD family efflux transporter periplasmic adaptor subunit n=1 Tax=Adhaeribacter soli TaxID=2607655 RepID=A0A5N1IJS9_9BACT|nr:HlyD family efflux transporter periplasmic adaptor subunit [Adhaeribacter soli]KAA9326003.1 HlyD family efflux transporter periplasmic adaptor subunit [Adhaeribacter soli]
MNLTEKENAPVRGFQALELARTPRWGKTLALWCAAIFGFLVLLLFLPWTQNISSYGTLTTISPAERPQTINSTIAGRIEKWHVREGQLVEKGDTIVSLAEVKDKYMDPALLKRLEEQLKAKEQSLEATEQKAEDLDRQLEALRQGLQVSLDKARNKVRQTRLKVQSDSADVIAQRNEAQIARVRLERQETLYRQGLKSLNEVESARLKQQEAQAKLVSSQNKLGTSRNELVNARLELSSLQAEYADKIAKAEAEQNATRSYAYSAASEIAKARSELSSTVIRSSFYQITAPQQGYVVKTLKAGIGEIVKEAEAIATVVPVAPHLAAELYVNPLDLPLLRTGQEVRLQFEGWPTLVFSGWPNISTGTFAGKIAVIDNLDTQGKYRILVTPDPKEEPWPEQLRVGSGVYGWALLGNVPVWYELWRQMNGFPADFPRNGPQAAPYKEKLKPTKDDAAKEEDK